MPGMPGLPGLPGMPELPGMPGLPRTIPDSVRVEDFNQGPPDFNSSALNYSAMPPPFSVYDD